MKNYRAKRRDKPMWFIELIIGGLDEMALDIISHEGNSQLFMLCLRMEMLSMISLIVQGKNFHIECLKFEEPKQIKFKFSIDALR